jgi:signal transduction histidine kinase/CheY-like chemotaxis protein
VVLIAIWMASVFTGSIMGLINGISRFRSGERHFRFNAEVKDELGTLADSFDEMADSLVASVNEPLVITDMDQKIIYANADSLGSMKKTLADILGQPYGENSIYPSGTAYCPITALDEGRETDVLYLAERQRYFKGKASYLTDKEGRNIGYIVVSTDVTEIIQKQVQLENAVREANKANESKGEFLARMSHEIRTPMNAIIGMTNIVKRKLGEDPLDLEDTKSCVHQIETSSQHLLGLLNDILDISKIEAGKIELTEETVDLPKLSETVVSIIHPRCEEKNIVFDTVFDVPCPACFMTDSLRLRQVLINLLGNAVKFTPECGRIELSIVQKERRDGRALLEFSIRDTGIGISESALASLFQPFEQGGRQISRRYGGTGLGLTISRRIVQLLGGDISVNSKEGEGSTFSFAVWMTEAAREDGDEQPVITDIENLFTGKKALMVDDVMVNRIIAIDLLSSTGMDIDEAEDGAVAVKMFENSPVNAYDIIYMDVQMPNMDGYEATSLIRGMSRPDAKTVPIVAITANAFKEDVDRALAHGMNTHLAKPLEIDKLIEVSVKLLGTKPAN